MATLETPLPMVLGKAAVRRLSEAGFHTVRDLVDLAPRRYYTWGKLTSIGWLKPGDEATLLVQVVNANLVANRSGAGVRLLVDITDGAQRLTCTFFAKNRHMLSPHQRLLKPGTTALVSGKVGEYRGKLQMVQPEFEELEDTSPEAVARRAGRPIPIYRSISGLPSWKVGALIRSVLDDLDFESVPEVVPKPVRERYSLLSASQALVSLHRPEGEVDWQTAKRTLAWQEALVLQTALRWGRFDEGGETRRRSRSIGSGQGAQVQQLLSGLPFQLTASQNEAWAQIRADLAGETPMQRLLQADVGAGKTVIALLAMVAAVESGGQAALLAPTEVLARQHFTSLSHLLDKAGLGVPVHLVTGKRPGAEKAAALAALASGEAGIVVGTHALIQDGVEVPELSLLVVDEQHRFGVAQRDRLRENRDWVPHLLVMTATPIPRTIAMTVFGDLDVTLMKGLPPGRKPVVTHLVSNQNQAWMRRLWERAREEVENGGRVYVVCPRIDAESDEDGDSREESEQAGAQFSDGVLDEGGPRADGGLNSTEKASQADGSAHADVPAASVVVEELRGEPELAGIEIALAHGRRRPEENAAAFARFASGESPILVATTVVEVGVDVPEATLMIVLGAQRFGLSQLHQLRGRVGRSERQSICLLVHGPTQSPVTGERLEAVASTTDGFALAEIDLRLRSEGDVLGQAQSGHLSALRFLSVRKDAGTIAAARAVSTQILEEDPLLSAHPDLAAQVRASIGADVIWLERN